MISNNKKFQRTFQIESMIFILLNEFQISNSKL